MAEGGRGGDSSQEVVVELERPPRRKLRRVGVRTRGATPDTVSELPSLDVDLGGAAGEGAADEYFFVDEPTALVGMCECGEADGQWRGVGGCGEECRGEFSDTYRYSQ